jgi:hypothetical protein
LKALGPLSIVYGGAPTLDVLDCSTNQGFLLVEHSSKQIKKVLNLLIFVIYGSPLILGEDFWKYSIVQMLSGPSDSLDYWMRHHSKDILMQDVLSVPVFIYT